MRYTLASIVALIAVCCSFALVSNCEDPKNLGLDGKPDIWYLNDKSVASETGSSKYSHLVAKTFDKNKFNLANSLSVGQKSKKTFFQTLEDRWDVKQANGFQFISLYDGINNPTVVNRLRAVLLSRELTLVANDLVELDRAFEAAKNGGREQIEQYLTIKESVFNAIDNAVTRVDNFNKKANSNSAAAAAVAIVGPNFVIIVQVGNVKVYSYKNLDALELTIDQSRSGPDSNAFSLAPCSNVFDQELCMNTRVFGHQKSKLRTPNHKPTHVLKPFIKLYKRVPAPSLNDNDIVFNSAVQSPATVAIPRSHRADSGGDEPSTQIIGALDSANKEVVIPEDSRSVEELQDVSEYKYLLLATAPITRQLTPKAVAKIVSLMFTDAFRKETGTLNSIMRSVVERVVEQSDLAASRDQVNNFVTSFFSDYSVVFVPLVTDPAKYHF